MANRQIKNDYRNEIAELGSLYADGRFIEAQIFLVETLVDPRDLADAHVSLPECLDYVNERYGDNEHIRPMLDMNRAFEQSAEFTENRKERTPVNVTRSIKGLSQVKKYMSEGDRAKVDKTLRKMRHWMKANTPDLEKKKKEQERSQMSDSEKYFKDYVRIYKYRKLTPAQKKDFSVKVQAAAYVFYNELKAKIDSPGTGYEEKVKCIEKIIPTIGWQDTSKTKKYMEKEKYYKLMSSLHYRNGANKEGDTAAQKADHCSYLRGLIFKHTEAKYERFYER